MKIAETKHLRGNIKTFTLKHQSKKLGKIEIPVNAINPANAFRKGWETVSKMYANRVA